MIGSSLKNNAIEIIVQNSSATELIIHKNSFIYVLLNNAKDTFEINNHTRVTINVDETPKKELSVQGLDFISHVLLSKNISLEISYGIIALRVLVLSSPWM